MAEGLFGWRVTDCVVTVVHSRFSAPTPPAGYFRALTTDVFAAALRNAGTTVCAPVSSFELEIPEDSLPTVLRHLVGHHAVPNPPTSERGRCRLTGTIPSDQLGTFEQRLPSLTSGQGVLLAEPAGFRPVTGTPPERPRSRQP
jgi:ribosomal protection tetracycline resistance protein